MRVEIHYFADDDTEFDSEEECKAYERSQKELFTVATFFDENMRLMQTESYYDIEEYAHFIIVHDAEKAAKLFEHLREMISFGDTPSTLHKDDVLYYDPNDGDWHDMEHKGNMILINATMMKCAAESNRKER